MKVRRLAGPLLCVTFVTLFGGACGTYQVQGDVYRRDPRFAPSAYEHYIRGRVAAEKGDHELAIAEMRMAAAVAPDEPEPRVAVAEELLAAGKVESAHVEAKYAVSHWADDASTWQLLGRVRVSGGNVRGAAEAFERAVALDKTDEESWLMLGATYRQLRQDRLALEAYRRLIAAMPLSAEGHYRLGRVLQQADPDIAGFELKRAIEIDPGHIDARVTLADLYRRQGRRDDAEKTLREALDRSGDDAQVGERLYHILVENGDRDGAAELLRRLDTDWRDARTRLRVASLLLELRHADEALAIARAILAKNPSNDAHLMEARALAQLGRRTEAVAACLLATPGDDAFIEARAFAGTLHGKLGSPQDGLRIVEETLATRPGDPVLVVAAATLHEKLGAFEDARRLLDESLVQYPGNEALTYARADLEDRVGQPDRAVEVMQRFLDKHPDSAIALNYIGFSYADRNVDLDAAEKLLRRAVALRPDDGFVLDSLGWLLYRQGQTEQARITLERADRMAPFEPAILQHLGEIYVRVGLAERARDSFRQALLLDPTEKLRARLEERVRTLEAKAP